jgi:primary-amine oxidase
VSLQTRVTHPLDPLTAEEVGAVAEIARRECPPEAALRFVSIDLCEPPKAEVLAWAEGDVHERRAMVVLHLRDERAVVQALVSVTHGSVVSWRRREDAQAPLTVGELLQCEQAVKADERWREAMRRRGLKDLDLAMVDPWPTGYNGDADDPARGRTLRPLTWMRRFAGDNGYARPVEGLVVRFDLDAMQVIEVEDHGVTPLPERDGNYTEDALSRPENFPHFPDGPRRDVRPLEIVQPEGPSFELDGHALRWQKWSLRIGFTYREGLVLHTIGYEDKGRVRPVIYRASLGEMFVPYGDPSPTHYRKNVFDLGEFGLGIWTNSLRLGCDCLGEIRYLDATINDEAGRAVSVENAICVHEEDVGLAWKHTDFRTGDVQARRLRRLVISSIATVGNYEYCYYWYLYQDGSIEYEVKLSGVISDGAIAPGELPANGALAAPGVYGPHHQHFFGVRLDMMLDGAGNSVYEMDSVPVPRGPENPYGNAWAVRPTLLARESQAQRLADARKARYWKIVNPSERNALGQPVGYRLHAGDGVLPMYDADAYAIKRARFAEKHLWVTAYDPDELYPTGDFPNQHPGGGGLPEYVAQDRPLENADIVVWPTFCAHHVVRPEDWPVMPVTRAGFTLKPDGFFDGNPALDLPAPEHCGHHVT